MKATLERMRQEFSSIRTGRATLSLLDRVRVEYYGAQVPVNQVANVVVPEPRLIEIKPWDKSTIPAIEKALHQSDLGLTPVNDGKVVRLSLPSLTEERRKELVRAIHKLTENYRVAVRNDRRVGLEHLDALKNDKKVSEDDQFHAKQDLQRLTDDYVKRVDDLLAHKEKEILEI